MTTLIGRTTSGTDERCVYRHDPEREPSIADVRVSGPCVAIRLNLKSGTALGNKIDGMLSFR